MSPRALYNPMKDAMQHVETTPKTLTSIQMNTYVSVKAANLRRAHNDTTARFKRLGEIGGGERQDSLERTLDGPPEKIPTRMMMPKN